MKISRISITLLLVGCVVLKSCVTLRLSKSEIDKELLLSPVPAHQHFEKYKQKNIHYVCTDDIDHSKPVVLFLHGSPGGLAGYSFLHDTALVNRAIIVAMDRPGFGYSDYGKGEPSLQNQAEVVAYILRKFERTHSIILVGYSLGGPLACRVAMDYPELTDKILLIAPSVDPNLEPTKYRWIQRPFSSAALNWMLPGTIRSSILEIYHLKTELQAMLPYWSQIQCQVTVLQGTKDENVPAGNADFLKTKLTKAPFDVNMVENADHSLPWSHKNLIRSTILKIIEEVDE